MTPSSTGEERLIIIGLDRATFPQATNEQLFPGSRAVITPYTAPEQTTASQTIDRRVDVYAVGAILAELLTGQPPFNATAERVLAQQIRSGTPAPLTAFTSALPRSLVDTIAAAMSRDPADRPATMTALLETLVTR